MPQRMIARVPILPLLALLLAPTLAGCARTGNYVQTVAQAERCRAKPEEAAGGGKRRAAQRNPVPTTPADSARAVTKAGAEVVCTGGLHR